MTGESVSGIENLYLEINGHRTHYLKAGSGPPVVLLHGGASDSRDWLGTMAALAHRFTLYAPDLIGFGQSERNEAGYYLSDFIEFTEEFVKILGLENPDMVGHSFGGRVGAGVAVRNRVKIRRLVLVDASGLGKVTVFGNALFTGFWASRQLLGCPQPFPRFLVKDGEDYNCIGDDALRSLRTSTLLIWKRHDPYFPVSLARRAVQLIPGARLEVLPGFGHAPNKQNINAFTRVLLDFLGRD
jgi:4,5:9,10-diseco-3-hydroxy-5,9,17-trioxoandrosta-1(10),2-diene-4-oate hydrolase